MWLSPTYWVVPRLRSVLAASTLRLRSVRTSTSLSADFDFAQCGLRLRSVRASTSLSAGFDFAQCGLRLRSVRLRTFIIFGLIMTPDYPHKLFSDKRNSYSMLMLTLAMDSAG